MNVIVPEGAAAKDGRIETGDQIVKVSLLKSAPFNSSSLFRKRVAITIYTLKSEKDCFT